MREENSPSNLAPWRNLQAKQHDIEIGQQSRKNRYPPKQGRSAHPAKYDGQKAMVQQAANDSGKAWPRVGPALKLSLAREIAIEKLL
jgi:hypothetical protein